MGSSVKIGLLVTGLFVTCLGGGSAAAQKQLVVGPGGVPWTAAQDASAFVQVAADSIWIWDAVPGQNLGPGILERGGSVRAARVDQASGESVFLATRAAEAMADGDESTAFNPDEAGVEREVEVYIDLGGAFRISRVRLFPRLDSRHLGFFPQTFELAQGSGRRILGGSGVSYDPFIRFASTRPNERAVYDWPGTRQVSRIVETRYLRFQPLSGLPWEIAELEIYADGTVPVGEFVSRPLLASGTYPAWGRVRHEGMGLSALPVVVQTRTGPDEEPMHYYVQIGGRLRRVNQAVWENIEEIPGAAEKGPVLPNPAWSPWETAAGGIVRSPSPNRFLQFRVRLLEAGAKLERLVFEYSTPPLAGQVEAEISPTVVDAGRETPFTLSLQMRRLETGSDLGFRFVEVRTPAAIVGVDRVRVDDREVVYTVQQKTDRGFTVNLWRRVLQDGSFVQIFFRGRVFVDGTRFQVRALDRRYTVEQEGEETVYQFAQEGDVEPLSLGASLAVRLSSADNPLVADVEPRAPAFTPNGDGVNDVFVLAYSLLKLTRPAPVFFEIFDLSGKRVRQGYVGEDESGRFVRLWDGRDQSGGRAAPGLYIYQVQVEADAETAARQGVVGVVY